MCSALSSPDADEETTAPDPEAPEASATSAETSEMETTSSERVTEQRPQVEEKVIVPLDREDEEHISSTITLLDKEEELDEDKEEGDYRGSRQGIQDDCSLLPPFSSFCSCAASLREFLHQQCSALLHKKRKCQALRKRETIQPMKTPVWHPSMFPTVCPERPQPPGIEVHQPRETEEQAAEPEPESRASSSEMPPPLPRDTVAESPREPGVLEAAQLEPSQTSNLPKPSAADSSSAKLTPALKTPQLSSHEPEPAEEKPSQPSASTTGSAHIQPTAATAVEAESEGEEDKSDTRASLPKTVTVQTTETGGHTQVRRPNPPPSAEHNSDAPTVSEDDLAEPEVAAPSASEGLPEPEPSADQPSLAADLRVDGLTEDASPSTPPPSVPVSSSLLDIYADPPNGTEPNGNPVHGSSQKESVFMRLNNRIKALEMNMSLSGRYLEQLSQR